MEREFFGFGHWNAPYWFIGPEQGKGRSEQISNEVRAERWSAALNRPEICDCRIFHEVIGDLTWHSRRVPLQPTWKKLILTLLAFGDQPHDAEHRRRYQADHWGRADGETCVIELSGTVSRSLSDQNLRDRFVAERVARIKSKLQLHPPRVVIMYGLGEASAWSEIAGKPLQVDTPVLLGKTVFAVAPHPNTRGRTNADWIDFAHRIRRLIQSG